MHFCIVSSIQQRTTAADGGNPKRFALKAIKIIICKAAWSCADLTSVALNFKAGIRALLRFADIDYAIILQLCWREHKKLLRGKTHQGVKIRPPESSRDSIMTRTRFPHNSHNC